MKNSRKIRRRHGGAVLELIICLPVLVIALFAIAEFAVLMANQQQLEYASRIGALVASEQSSLPTSGSVPTDVENAIKRHLTQAGIDTSDNNIRITLEHNVDDDATMAPAPPFPLTSGNLVCPAPVVPDIPSRRQYVRVTVCLHIVDAKMTPNLLKTFGFDLNGRITQQTTTLRYELEPQP